MTFEESWPELSSRLARLLIAKRIPESVRDDIVQETGIRLLRVWDRVDPKQGAWGLARTIALHAVSDDAGYRGRYETVGLTELAETTDPSDSEEAAIARFRLSSVGLALSHMSMVDGESFWPKLGSHHLQVWVEAL